MNKIYKYKLAIYILTGLVLAAVFFIPIVFRGLEIWTDSYYYLSGGKNIASGNGFSHGCAVPEPVTRWPPLYSLYISLFYLFNVHWYSIFENIAIINFCAFAVVCAVLVHRLGIGVLTGGLMMILLLFHPFVLRWAASALSESTSWIWLGLAELLVLAMVSVDSGGKRRDYILLAAVLSIGFLTRYAFAGVIIATVAFWGLRYLQQPGKAKLKNAVIFCTVTMLICGAWLVRNYYMAGSAAESDGSDTRLFRNLYYGVMNLWDIFMLFRPGNMYLSLLIFFLIPLFCYRAYINSKKADALSGFITFNYLLIVLYTATIILLRTTSAAITLDSRMFSLLVFPFVFVLPDINIKWLRISVLFVLIILSATRYKEVLRADTVYEKVHSYEVYKKAVGLSGSHKIYTFDPVVFLLDAKLCIDDEVFKLDEQLLNRELAENEVIVVFYNTYKFKRYKGVYEELLRKNTYRKELFGDGVIFYP